MTETSLPAKPELRYATVPFKTEIRSEPGTEGNGGRDLTLVGYAAVTGQETTLYDGSFFRLREVIAPGAFRDVLAAQPDVHLVIGHNMDLPMARTGITGRGSLDLAEEDGGLRVHARLNPDVSYIRDLSLLMDDGVVDQMSFAFTIAPGGDERSVTEDANGKEDELRTITRIGQLYDVTVTPQGAYPQTSAALRSLRGLAWRAPQPDLTPEQVRASAGYTITRDGETFTLPAGSGTTTISTNTTHPDNIVAQADPAGDPPEHVAPADPVGALRARLDRLANDSTRESGRYARRARPR